MNKNTKIALAVGGGLIVVVAAYFMMGSDSGAAVPTSRPNAREVAADDSDLQDAADTPRRGSVASPGSSNRSGRLGQDQQPDDVTSADDSSEVQQREKTKRAPKRKRPGRQKTRSRDDEDDSSKGQQKGEVPPASLFDGDN